MIKETMRHKDQANQLEPSQGWIDSPGEVIKHTLKCKLSLVSLAMLNRLLPARHWFSARGGRSSPSSLDR